MTPELYRPVSKIRRVARRPLSFDVWTPQPRLSAKCAACCRYPHHAEALGRAIGERTRDLNASVVLSPALGGVVIWQEVGRALSGRAIFAERQEGALTLRRGFTLAPRTASSSLKTWSLRVALLTRRSSARATGGQVSGPRRYRPERRRFPTRRFVSGAGPAAAPDLRSRQVPSV